MSAAEPPQQHVVVGVDGSPESRAALHWAVEHAALTGSVIRAIAIWSPTVVSPESHGLGAGAVVAGGPLVRPGTRDDEPLRSAAAQVLDEAAAALPPEAARRMDRQVMAGDAATVLVDAAQDAALLVLGNAGRGALAGALTGSVALRCAHRAGCPVVLVPAG